MIAIRPCGERALIAEIDGGHEAVIRLAALARAELGDAALDVVPGHRTVLVSGRDALPDAALIEELAVRAGYEDGGEPPAAEPVEIAVRYDGPDLAAVAALCGVSAEEVARRHAAPLYQVAFVGFAPGFAYLVGGDPLLELPRLDEPRTRVPAGSVAVAGPYSAIYPSASPGGWRLIGSSDALLFDPTAARPALLEPGAGVRFVEAR
jgi:KipI family sensor histidine kinase inhibitor